MTDIQNSTPHYRDGNAVGFKGNSALTLANGIAAAARVNKTLARRHRQVMEAFTRYGAEGATPELVGVDLGLPVHVVRPRCGELVKRGLLHQIGRRKGDLGCLVTAYSVQRPEAQGVLV